MKPLIVYYSFSGNNKSLAEKLQQRFRCDILRIEEVTKRSNFTILLDLVFKRNPRIKPYTTDLQVYDCVILVGPIWAGKISTPLKSFISGARKQFKAYAFISLCSGAAGQKEKVEKSLSDQVGQRAVAVEELCVNDLLPAGKKGQIKYTTGYRVQPGDWFTFQPKLNQFSNKIHSFLAEPSAHEVLN